VQNLQVPGPSSGQVRKRKFKTKRAQGRTKTKTFRGERVTGRDKDGTEGKGVSPEIACQYPPIKRHARGGQQYFLCGDRVGGGLSRKKRLVRRRRSPALHLISKPCPRQRRLSSRQQRKKRKLDVHDEGIRRNTKEGQAAMGHTMSFGRRNNQKTSRNLQEVKDEDHRDTEKIKKTTAPERIRLRRELHCRCTDGGR